MSDSSKKINKNAKRREKARDRKLKELVDERRKEEESNVKVDPTIAIKQQLAEAKADGVKFSLKFSFLFSSLKFLTLNLSER